jgi:hypothetical protein
MFVSVHSPAEKYLLQDLLALHMIRSSDPSGSTIISYHPSAQWDRTTAERLNKLVHKVGESVYWQKIFEQSKDPTFFFLAILWYALYAWDESLDHLYTHMNWLVRFFVAVSFRHLAMALIRKQMDYRQMITTSRLSCTLSRLNSSIMLHFSRISANL